MNISDRFARLDTFHHIGQGPSQGCVDICVTAVASLQRRIVHRGSHKSLRRSSFANQCFIRQSQGKAVRRTHVVDRLFTSFQKNHQAIGTHGFDRLRGEQNHLALREQRGDQKIEMRNSK